MRYEKEEEEVNNVRNENGPIDYKKFNRLTDAKERDINNEIVRNHFLVQDLGDLLKKLRKSPNISERNQIQVNLINSGLRDPKEEIEDLNEPEKETENPNEIVDIIENILEFNKQQQETDIKILTPNQLLSRLLILLSQLKVENDSEKLQNEIRQFLYSLYRSKKLTKKLYKTLHDII